MKNIYGIAIANLFNSENKIYTIEAENELEALCLLLDLDIENFSSVGDVIKYASDGDLLVSKPMLIDYLAALINEFIENKIPLQITIDPNRPITAHVFDRGGNLLKVEDDSVIEALKSMKNKLGDEWEIYLKNLNNFEK